MSVGILVVTVMTIHTVIEMFWEDRIHPYHVTDPTCFCRPSRTEKHLRLNKGIVQSTTNLTTLMAKDFPLIRINR